ncbi:MAG: galactokinase [Anaerolineae bacterium]|nr:galactokinase [Anaerolineae bacterium]
MSRLRDHFLQRFGRKAEVIVRAPGRVNLIGEHTDYNDGFVLPIAIDRNVLLAAARRDDHRVHLVAVDLDDEDEFDVTAPTRSETKAWANYHRGVAAMLQQRGIDLTGADVMFSSNVPIGAGLSSSAAVEVAAAFGFLAISDQEMDRAQMALACQQAEHEYAGVPCGIMDQFISALGRADSALLLDCRDLSYRHVPVPESARIVVADTGVRRALAGSEYRVRRSQCEEAVRLLQSALPGIRALRDVSEAELQQYEHLLPDPIRRRARHVVTENQRVLDTVAALEAGDLRRAGELLIASHHSLRDDYEVSSTELDAMVEAALAAPGCFGSRLTGAGFGGCTVSLVANEAVKDFVRSLAQTYRERTGRDATVYVTRAADGVGLVA